MNSGEIDRLPVGQLSQRYDLARSAVYTRMEALGIKPERVGNKAYINAAQIRLMDELHRFIQSGGTTAEFLNMRGMRGAQREQSTPENPSTGLSTVQTDFMGMVSAIVSEVVSRIQPAPEPHPMEYYKYLEEAVRNCWLLKTSEVAYLLDRSPNEINRYGDRFSDAGFVFTKAGYRGQGEVAWRVTKHIQ